MTDLNWLLILYYIFIILLLDNVFLIFSFLFCFLFFFLLCMFFFLPCISFILYLRLHHTCFHFHLTRFVTFSDLPDVGRPVTDASRSLRCRLDWRHRHDFLSFIPSYRVASLPLLAKHKKPNKNNGRHETSVSSQTIEIIHQDDEVVVIDKPCSIPVRNVKEKNKKQKVKRHTYTVDMHITLTLTLNARGCRVTILYNAHN